MEQPRRNNALVIALYVNAALLLAILVAFLTRDGSPTFLSAAHAAPLGQPIAGGGTVYLMPAQFSQNTYGAYVMDIDKQTLCAYQYFPGTNQLRFVSARRFSHDLRMEDFNTLPPPADIKKLIEQRDAGIRGDEGKVEVVPQVDPDADK